LLKTKTKTKTKKMESLPLDAVFKYLDAKNLAKVRAVNKFMTSEVNFVPVPKMPAHIYLGEFDYSRCEVIHLGELLDSDIGKNLESALKNFSLRRLKVCVDSFEESEIFLLKLLEYHLDLIDASGPILKKTFVEKILAKNYTTKYDRVLYFLLRAGAKYDMDTVFLEKFPIYDNALCRSFEREGNFVGFLRWHHKRIGFRNWEEDDNKETFEWIY